MEDPIVVTTKSIMRRTWSSIEPKLAATFVSGEAFAWLIDVLTQYGVKIPGDHAEVALLLGSLVGYLIPSAGTSITVNNGSGVTEKHSGQVVSIVTSGIPKQPVPDYLKTVPADAPEPSARAQSIIGRLGQPTGDVDQQATVALPPSTPDQH